MKIAAKLWGLFGLFAATLVGALAFQVATLRQATASATRVSDIAARHRAITGELTSRIELMMATGRKYVVTRDHGYALKLAALADSQSAAVSALRALPQTPEERARVAGLSASWRTLADSIAIAADTSLRLAGRVAAIQRLEAAWGPVRHRTEQLAQASQAAMARELERSRLAAVRSERVSWRVAGAALLLGVIAFALLARSIAAPLATLADATRDIAGGNFDVRIRAEGSDEVAAVSRDFNSMSARLAELDRLKREFVSNVSHDLKTPLSSMQETTDSILDGLAGPLTDTQRRLLLLNRESALRLASMIGKLLDLARAEARRPEPRELLDFTGLVRRAVDHMNAGRSERRGAPVVTLSGTDPRLVVHADAEGVAQVLDNLLENAVKFSPPDGVVRVTLAERDGAALLQVADEGPGIPDGDKARVFDRFHQTEAGRAVRWRGVGLGLSICRQVVTAHGGRIYVTDNAPRGTVFHVLFPGAVVVHAGLGEGEDVAEALT